MHVMPHEMPAGLDVTVPLPVPFLTIVSCSVSSVNVAVAVFAAVIVTVHTVPIVPAHAPDQLVKLEAVEAVAGSVTIVPESYISEHVRPQLIAPMSAVTPPPP